MNTDQSSHRCTAIRALASPSASLMAAVLLWAVPVIARAQSFPLYATSVEDDTVLRINSSGAVTVFANTGNTSYPTGLAFDSSGDLFEVNSVTNTITKFDATGGVLSNSGTPFTSSGLADAQGLAFDSAGDLFVANLGGSEGDILKFTATGGVLSPVATTFTHINLPCSLAFDRAGDLFEISQGYTTIMEYALTGGVLSSTPSIFRTGLNSSVDIAFDPAGDLFEVSSTTNSIEEFIATGGVLSTTGTVFTTSGLSDATSLAFDSAGDLFEAANGAIEKFTVTGGVLSTTGSVFASGYPLDEPTFIAFTPAPEPGCATLLTLGIGALLGWRRRPKFWPFPTLMRA